MAVYESSPATTGDTEFSGLRAPSTLSSDTIGILIVNSPTKPSVLLFMITNGFLKIQNTPFESPLKKFKP
jgi:hypothetical protein